MRSPRLRRIVGCEKVGPNVRKGRAQKEDDKKTEWLSTPAVLILSVFLSLSTTVVAIFVQAHSAPGNGITV